MTTGPPAVTGASRWPPPTRAWWTWFTLEKPQLLRLANGRQNHGLGWEVSLGGGPLPHHQHSQVQRGRWSPQLTSAAQQRSGLEVKTRTHSPAQPCPARVTLGRGTRFEPRPCPGKTARCWGWTRLRPRHHSFSAGGRAGGLAAAGTGPRGVSRGPAYLPAPLSRMRDGPPQDRLCLRVHPDTLSSADVVPLLQGAGPATGDRHPE